jgi:hypothetical protein
MKWMYHLTNKKNLGAIKKNGFAPLSMRAPGPGNGSTQNNRNKREESNRKSQLRTTVGTLLAAGYKADSVVAKSQPPIEIKFNKERFGVIQEIPYVYPEGGFPGDIGKWSAAGNFGLEDLISEYEKIIAKYMALLVKKSGKGPSVPQIKEQFNGGLLDRFHGHFLKDLVWEYVKLKEDIEAEITRHRLYFFDKTHFKAHYSEYLDYVASNDHTQTAILRVNFDVLNNPMQDSSQGNAAAVKHSIGAESISFRISQSVQDMNSGRALDDDPPWEELANSELVVDADIVGGDSSKDHLEVEKP